MQRLVAKLLSEGLVIDQIIPDGKSHRFPSAKDDDGRNLSWYLATQNFSAVTGELFYVILFADWSRSIQVSEYCTLLTPGASDRATIKRRIKEGKKAEISERNEMLKNAETGVKYDLGAKLGNIHEDEEIQVTDPNSYVYALGFNEKDYFFTTSSNQQIVAISRFSDADMLGLMPLSYWESTFPGGGAQRVDWTMAKSALMDQARLRGVFQARRVRGAGVWSDGGRIVVNMGDHLIVDGERTSLGGITSRYFYTLGESLSTLHSDPLSCDECNVLLSACSTFKWLKPDYSFIMAGALVVSRVCGALPIRPHLWLTGGATTGKSTLLEKLIQPLLGDNALYVLGATSEAGIRQSIKANALPVVFDEFETTGQKSGEKVAEVTELLRSSWSDTSAMIIKGSAGGNAMAYQVKCCGIMSSIRVKLGNDADRSRFSQVELAPHGSDAEHWAELSALLVQIDSEYAERLFARTIKMVPILLENFKRLKVALATKVSSRFGDQYGMLLAGYSLLLSDNPMTDEEAAALVAYVQLVDEKEDAKLSDHEECLSHLLTKKIQIEREGTRYDFAIGECIRQARLDPDGIGLSLQRVGIRVSSKNVAIASRHTELESQIYRGTRWSTSWASSLSRISGAQKNKSTWLSGTNVKCVILPIEPFISA
jgi:putative DNA primase/helicase